MGRRSYKKQKKTGLFFKKKTNKYNKSKKIGGTKNLYGSHSWLWLL